MPIRPENRGCYQRCHLAYDRGHHAETRRNATGQLRLDTSEERP